MADEKETLDNVSQDNVKSEEKPRAQKEKAEEKTKSKTAATTKKKTSKKSSSETGEETKDADKKPRKRSTRKKVASKKDSKTSSSKEEKPQSTKSKKAETKASSEEKKSEVKEEAQKTAETKEESREAKVEEPKKTTRRRRTTKKEETPQTDKKESEAKDEKEAEEEKKTPAKAARRTTRKRTTTKRTKKATTEAKEEAEDKVDERKAETEDADAKVDAKATAVDEAEKAKDQNVVSEPSPKEEKPRRRRVTRRKKTVEEASDTPSQDEMTELTQNATVANPEPSKLPFQVLDKESLESINKEEKQEASTRLRRTRRVVVDETTSSKTNTKQYKSSNTKERTKKTNNKKNQTQEPTLTREGLAELKVAELREKAKELGLDPKGIKKAELVELVYKEAAKAEGFKHFKGILEIQNDGYGFVRAENYMQGEKDSFVFQQTIKQYRLRNGDEIEGNTIPPRNKNSFPPVHTIEKINGRDPSITRTRARFKDLTPIYPDERLVMECGKDSITGRAIDNVAPIGKGQRGLIVSPPKAGKTTVLKHVCKSIAQNNPEVHLICLLVDERPEEVTDMQRSIKGEVVASTFDMPAENHTTVSELVMERAKRLVEQGDDVVVVLDSITRLARAYNISQPASGRILSGGVDSAALYPPKRFLGAARNIEGGGSLTILASALVDTGSKMDEVIFEEFKGTGNMELKLDRGLADKRIYPAIDPIASGTRNEDLLLDDMTRTFIWGLRRSLANLNDTERAATSLIKGLKQTPSNQDFLIRAAKKAQQMDM